MSRSKPICQNQLESSAAKLCLETSICKGFILRTHAMTILFHFKNSCYDHFQSILMTVLVFCKSISHSHTHNLHQWGHITLSPEVCNFHPRLPRWNPFQMKLYYHKSFAHGINLYCSKFDNMNLNSAAQVVCKGGSKTLGRDHRTGLDGILQFFDNSNPSVCHKDEFSLPTEEKQYVANWLSTIIWYLADLNWSPMPLPFSPKKRNLGKNENKWKFKEDLTWT